MVMLNSENMSTVDVIVRCRTREKEAIFQVLCVYLEVAFRELKKRHVKPSVGLVVEEANRIFNDPDCAFAENKDPIFKWRWNP